MKNRLFLIFLVSLGIFSCGGVNSTQQQLNPSQSDDAEAISTLGVQVSTGCFNRYERCASGTCLYGYDFCLCNSIACPSNPQMPPIQWGTTNSSDDPVTITRTTATFLNSSGNILGQYECNISDFRLEASGTIPLPIPSCSVSPGDPFGVDYQPSTFDFRNSSLKFTVFYHDEGNAERMVSTTKRMQVFREN